LIDFDSIYKEFQPRIRRYLGNLVCEDDALDLSQTVFLKVGRSLDTFRGECSLSTWIYRIATNTARDHAASSSARQKGLEQLLDEEISVEDFADQSELDPDREYIRREMSACIRGILDQLPESYRTVLLLSEFEDLANSEIAEVLDTSVDTVKVRLHRGRTALRKAMTSQCSLYHDERSELMCDRKGK